jgi:parvulin-like peptidyl-prolyl isomerase
MLRRRPVVVQRRGPGLLGMAARTAVVAGTATAVSRGVSNSMDTASMNRQQQQQMAQNTASQSQADIEQMKAQLAEMQAQQLQVDQARATTAAAPSAQPDLMTQLQQLSQLKQSGDLTADEFQAAKARLLAG